MHEGALAAARVRREPKLWRYLTWDLPCAHFELGRVAVAHVLHVEDAGVGEWVIGLKDELVLLVERLEDRVRVAWWKQDAHAG